MMSGTCEYMEEWLDDMYIAVSEALQSEGESIQQRWLMAQNMDESVKKISSPCDRQLRLVVVPGGSLSGRGARHALDDSTHCTQR